MQSKEFSYNEQFQQATINAEKDWDQNNVSRCFLIIINNPRLPSSSVSFFKKPCGTFHRETKSRKQKKIG